MGNVLRNGLLYRVLLVILVQDLHLAIPLTANEDLNFVPWGKPCKVPSKEGQSDPSGSCDLSKGIICQEFQDRNNYCSCSNLDRLSYDKESQECRIKPKLQCYYINRTNDPEEYDRLPYQLKCHDNSECVRKDEGKVGNCDCKPGFRLKHNWPACEDINGAFSKLAPTLPLLSLLLFSLLSLL